MEEDLYFGILNDKKDELFSKLYECIKEEGIHEIISNYGKLNEIKLKFQLLNEEDIQLCCYLVAIDEKDVKSINDLDRKFLNENNTSTEKKKDIYNILYKRKFLDQNRLQKLICMFLNDGIQFKITSSLLISIIEKEDIESLKLIVENIVYNNNYIKLLLYTYKFKTHLSNKKLENIFLGEINKICLNKLSSVKKNKVLKFSLKSNYEDFVKLFLLVNMKMKNGKRYYPLCDIFFDYETIKLLMEYAFRNDVFLEVNEKNNDGDNPLSFACLNNNIEMVQLLMNYANKKGVVLELNEKRSNGNGPLSLAVFHDNIEMVQLLMDYAENNKIILELNEIDNNGHYPLADACSKNNIEMVKLLMDYAVKNNINLELNKKNHERNYPLLLACTKKNIEMIQLLMEYANKNNITLDINEKNYSYYPLYWACTENVIEIVRLLIDYANINDIKLELNEKNRNGEYPLLKACYYKNIEIVRLLLEYANKN